MGLAIALVVILITCLSGYFFLAKTWWFPVHITANYGHAIDHQFMLTLAITGAIFVVAQLALAYAVWRYRDRRDGRKAGYSHGNNKLELTWTTAAAIIFIGLNLMGYHIWAFVHFMGPQPGSMRVEVWGEQFAWYFRYPGPDGKFGPVHVDKVDDATGNYLGLDRDRDSDSKDDIVTATLAIPVNQPVGDEVAWGSGAHTYMTIYAPPADLGLFTSDEGAGPAAVGFDHLPDFGHQVSTELQTGPEVRRLFAQVKALARDVELAAHFCEFRRNRLLQLFFQVVVRDAKGKPFRDGFFVNDALEGLLKS
ncbi:MAG: cytochrome c oxidase subunit II transmembrane domain-containing protein [Terriglobia bacterium]|jgi:cytochrome c oxidase subunit 2